MVKTMHLELVGFRMDPGSQTSVVIDVNLVQEKWVGCVHAHLCRIWTKKKM